jgi:hypothetical protein
MKVTNSINASMRRVSLHALPDDILEKIVNKYKTLFSRVKYKLKDWIPLEKLNWVKLSSNPNAIELLKANYDEIDWRYLSGNPSTEAIELLQKNIHEINWEMLSQNPNSAAIELLKKYPENISWHWLSKNPNPAAIKLLEANPDKIAWYYLSENPSTEAIELLKANDDEIDWQYLSKNPNPKAIEISNLQSLLKFVLRVCTHLKGYCLLFLFHNQVILAFCIYQCFLLKVSPNLSL